MFIALASLLKETVYYFELQKNYSFHSKPGVCNKLQYLDIIFKIISKDRIWTNIAPKFCLLYPGQ